MFEGTRYQSTVEEWAELINAPKESKDDLDVYDEKKKDHNSMTHMYREIPDKALETTSLDMYTSCCLVCLQSTGSLGTHFYPSLEITR